MKNFLFLLTFVLAGSAIAQDPVLYEYNWYLWELTVDGTLIAIPDNGEVNSVTLIFQDEEPDYFRTTVCNDLFGSVSIDIDTMTFTDMGITLIKCTDPANSAFEIPYFDFFFSHDGIPFDYEIGIIDGPEDGDGFILFITNPDGDTAFYGDKPPLSVPDNTISSLSIYPNPAYETIRWNATETKPVTIRVYSALGKIMLKKAQLAQQLDVSMLKPGLYFIEIANDNGISRAKFLKR